MIMKSFNWKKYTLLIGVLFLFPLIWVIFFGVMGKHHFKTLPYFDSQHLEGDTTLLGHRVASVSLVDENFQSFDLKQLRGKVWLACFYDLSDDHIGKITERLLNVNFKYRDEPDIGIVVIARKPDSLSQQAVTDYLKGLTKYNKFDGKWKYLMASDSIISKIEKESFFIQDLSSEARFRLVDTEGHIRGLYGNTEYHMQSIIEDIALLKKEVDIARYKKKHAQE
jgi:cytochrome oxidase Cu insertion factor (SCO1/SenC/PrrC family)